MQQAYVPWSDLKVDIVLILFSIAAPLLSLFFGDADWFQRSGAITALLAAIVAYRSLNKHYRKFMLKSNLTTSTNQKIIDLFTLVLSTIGTVIWAYGDKIINLF